MFDIIKDIYDRVASSPFALVVVNLTRKVDNTISAFVSRWYGFIWSNYHRDWFQDRTIEKATSESIISNLSKIKNKKNDFLSIVHKERATKRILLTSREEHVSIVNYHRITACFRLLSLFLIRTSAIDLIVQD